MTTNSDDIPAESSQRAPRSNGGVPVDSHNGRWITANGGSELMYDALMRRLPRELSDPFQIIVSRVRELEPGKKHILWCQDPYYDPEAQHLGVSELRRRFKKIVFVSN